jgi:hypothetical protein
VDVVNASVCWDGPERDILQVFVEPTPKLWGITWDDLPDELDVELGVLRELDANEEPTGRVAGIEILDFLRFDRWDAVPQFPLLWQLPGWEPLSLVDLLQRLQPQLREQAHLAEATSRGPRAD